MGASLRTCLQIGEILEKAIGIKRIQAYYYVHLDNKVDTVSVRDTVSRLPGGPGKTPAVYQSANTGLISWEVGRN